MVQSWIRYVAANSTRKERSIDHQKHYRRRCWSLSLSAGLQGPVFYGHSTTLVWHTTEYGLIHANDFFLKLFTLIDSYVLIQVVRSRNCQTSGIDSLRNSKQKSWTLIYIIKGEIIYIYIGKVAIYMLYDH